MCLKQEDINYLYQRKHNYERLSAPKFKQALVCMEYIQEMRVWQQRSIKEVGERSVGKKIQVLAEVGRFDETRHLVRRGLDLVCVPGPVMNMCLVQTLLRSTLSVTHRLDCNYSLQK